jgi:lipopolysaccharide export LptBFGC system permease protein LptF
MNSTKLMLLGIAIILFGIWFMLFIVGGWRFLGVFSEIIAIFAPLIGAVITGIGFFMRDNKNNSP